MASDKTVLLAATQTLTNKTLTSPTITTPTINGDLSGTVILDEDDLSTDSATRVASQQSIKAYVDSGTVTMTNKTLTSPVINTQITGTAIVDEDDMASDSAVRVPTQQSVKAYVTSGTVTITNKTLTSPKINEDVAVTATASEINTACDGITATAAEINARCDGVPSISTGQNAGVVTVTDSGVSIATVDLGTVTSGDFFYIEAQTTGTKGATEGRNLFYMNKSSGTATISYAGTAISRSQYQEASISYEETLGGMVQVTGSGTLVMELYGYSFGSNLSISAGNADIGVTFLKKQ